MSSNVYGSTKIFHHIDHIKEYVNKNVINPIHIRIKPTNICNHDCWFCAYHSDNLSLGEQMKYKDTIPREKIIEICKDIVSMNVKAVTFSGGGEPLAYPFLKEAIDILYKGNVKMGYITNGSLLNGEIAKNLAKTATWVRISMDGYDNQSLSKSRNVKNGEFEKIIQNIINFKKNGDRVEVGVSLIVTKENYKKIKDLGLELERYGVDHLKISPCITSNQSKESNDYHKDIYENVQKEISQLNKDARKMKILNHYHYEDLNYEKSYTSCPQASFLTIIGADQKIYTCQDKAYTETGALGCMKNRSFKELWNSNELQERLRKINPKILCNHHCVANEKNKLMLNYFSQKEDHKDFV